MGGKRSRSGVKGQDETQKSRKRKRKHKNRNNNKIGTVEWQKGQRNAEGYRCQCWCLANQGERMHRNELYQLPLVLISIGLYRTMPTPACRLDIFTGATPLPVQERTKLVSMIAIDFPRKEKKQQNFPLFFLTDCAVSSPPLRFTRINASSRALHAIKWKDLSVPLVEYVSLFFFLFGSLFRCYVFVQVP